ncbi:hypothetical protein C8Q77DRAFT_643857 [Trametes polyzona]|nr:hypothetical protein C8Q77DRAFT_643857 [Trametes polyzona]
MQFLRACSGPGGRIQTSAISVFLARILSMRVLALQIPTPAVRGARRRVSVYYAWLRPCGRRTTTSVKIMLRADGDGDRINHYVPNARSRVEVLQLRPRHTRQDGDGAGRNDVRYAAGGGESIPYSVCSAREPAQWGGETYAQGRTARGRLYGSAPGEISTLQRRRRQLPRMVPRPFLWKLGGHMPPPFSRPIPPVSPRCPESNTGRRD